VSAPYIAAPTAMATVNKGPWAAVLCAKKTPEGETIDRAVDGQEKRHGRGRIEYVDQLFNVEDDPHQERNLASEHPETLAELRSLLVSAVIKWGAQPAHIALWE
jgi:hypothetical protein